MPKQKLFLSILLGAGVIALIIASVARFYLYGHEDQPPLHLAVVAPLSGDEAALGRALREGVELEVARMNQTGGIAGRQIAVLAFDDGNTPEQARVAAGQAVASDAVAVIGHTRAATLAAAEPVYAAARLPVLTLAADLNATSASQRPFAGRLLGDETYEIRFLSNYLRNVIGEKTVHLLYEDSPRGTALANAFDETLQRFGTRVVYRWGITPGSDRLKVQAAAAAKELVDGKLPGIVLVIADAADSARAVAALRAAGLRNPIAGTRSFATDSFVDVLKREWRGTDSVESVVSGSLLSVPLLYDVVGQVGQNFRTDFILQFNHAPDWVAAYANDAARLIISQLGAADAAGSPPDWRAHLTQRLSALPAAGRPVIGLNGPIVLNPQSREIRPPLIGTYEGIDLISTLVQLVPIREEGTGNLMQQFVEGRALYVNDRFMYRTNVVYTGIRPYNVSALSVREGTVEQDFEVWFRWRGDFDPQDIVFSNAVTPIVLGKPDKEAKIGDMQYRSYRVKGEFFMNFSGVRRAFDTKLIGVDFTHRLLSRHNLMYVTDIMGMGLTRDHTLQSFLESSSMVSAAKDEGLRELFGKAIRVIRNFLYSGSSLSDPLISLLSRSNLLAGAPGWIIEKAWVSQDIVSRSSDGDPKFVGFGRPAPDFSQLEMGIILKPDLIRARDVIPSQYFLYIAVFSAIGALLAFLLDRRYSIEQWRLQTFLLRLVCWPLLLISFGNLLLDYGVAFASASIVNLIWMTYRIAFWFVPAALAVLAVERFLWAPLERRTQRKIPKIMRWLANLLVYLCALIGVMAYVFEWSITSMLAATGLSAMIVGLAIKDSIANVFAGIIINLEKPFAIGDFIRVGNTSGTVVDITWRTTRIEPDAGYIVSLPNAKLSESELQNVTRNRAGYEYDVKIMVNAMHDPELVKPLLAAAIKDCPYLLTKDGEPILTIRARDLSNVNQLWVMTYNMNLRVEKTGFIFRLYDYFWPRLWKQLNDAGIPWEPSAGEFVNKESGARFLPSPAGNK